MYDNKNSVRLAQVFVKLSQKFEKAGATKVAFWFERRAESFDKSLAASNFAKRF